MTELEKLLHQQHLKRDGSPDGNHVGWLLKNYKIIDTGEVYLEIGDAKPTIDSTIYYDDETPRPDSNNFEVFKAYNIRHNLTTNGADKIDDQSYTVWVFNNCSTDRTGGKLKNWKVTRVWDEPHASMEARRATPDEIAAIKQGLAEIRQNYEKRLAAYWNRYSQKVTTYGYWADR